MQYSLLSRFQGALFGAIVGEAIALSPTLNSIPPLKFDRFTRFYTTSLADPTRPENPDDPIFQAPLSPIEVAIALLPVLLFFHENPLKLKHNLQEVLRIWQNASVHQADLVQVASVISQSLLEAPLSVSNDTILSTLLNQSIPLEEAMKLMISTQPSEHDLAIECALYCFLSTKGNFRLSVLRAARTQQQIPICALTGALSGAYNSLRGIPVEWRLAIQSWTSETGEIVTQAELLQLATRLFAQWSGVYDSSQTTLEALAPTVAAPQVLRKPS
jgi:ADP-ribosylglycohydrolase